MSKNKRCAPKDKEWKGRLKARQLRMGNLFKFYTKPQTQHSRFAYPPPLLKRGKSCPSLTFKLQGKIVAFSSYSYVCMHATQLHCNRLNRTRLASPNEKP